MYSVYLFTVLPKNYRNVRAIIPLRGHTHHEKYYSLLCSKRNKDQQLYACGSEKAEGVRFVYGGEQIDPADEILTTIELWMNLPQNCKVKVIEIVLDHFTEPSLFSSNDNGS